jgi:ZIP family zinc transporter
MLVFSVTLHNIPEGLCAGVAFGALAYDLPGSTLAGALLLALGIGLQNFPEGAAISLPLWQGGFSRRRAFFMGQLSGAAEPPFAVLGALLVMSVRALLPFSLSFAAGAMIYVVASELLPEGGENKSVTAIAAIAGFSVMMLMDTVFG